MKKMLYNATISMANDSLMNIQNWKGVIAISIVAALIIGIVLSYSLHSRLYRFFRLIGRTWQYFVYGTTGLVAIGIVGAMFYYGGAYSTANNYLLLKIIGGVISGYFAIVGFGWIIKKVGDYVSKRHKIIVKKYKSVT